MSATISASTSIATITFDQQLVPGSMNKSNWNFNADLGLGPKVNQPVAVFLASGDTITGPTAVVGSALQYPIVVFMPPPFDVVGLNGQPAQPFSGFPLTVLP